MKDISEFYEQILRCIDIDLSDIYRIGIIKNFRDYLQRVSADVITVEGEQIFVPDTLITKEYMLRYYEKSERDFSVKDCSFIAIRHVGIPAEEELSVESLEKKIRDIIANAYTDKAYIKRVNGNVNAVCVDWQTAQEITSSQAVLDYVQKQVKKAEKWDIHADKIAWRAYEFQKKKIAWLDSVNRSAETDLYTPFTLSSDKKTSLMAEAVFKMLYTDFDFKKFESYTDEMSMLDDNWDFGKRFQELFDIFNAPDYKGEFYQLRSDNTFIDALAEKIAEKILEKGVKPKVIFDFRD